MTKRCTGVAFQIFKKHLVTVSGRKVVKLSLKQQVHFPNFKKKL